MKLWRQIQLEAKTYPSFKRNYNSLKVKKKWQQALYQLNNGQNYLFLLRIKLIKFSMEYKKLIKFKLTFKKKILR